MSGLGSPKTLALRLRGHLTSWEAQPPGTEPHQGAPHRRKIHAGPDPRDALPYTVHSQGDADRGGHVLLTRDSLV